MSSSTLPVPQESNDLAAAERARSQIDPVILEFFERRRRRAQAHRARELTEQAAHYWHEHPDNRLAELALHVALDAERRAEREYLDPVLAGIGYTSAP